MSRINTQNKSIPEDVESDDIVEAHPTPKAIPEHMRKLSCASTKDSFSAGKRGSIEFHPGVAESRENIELHGQRRSSIFSTEQMMIRLTKDRGDSIVSLIDNPSFSKSHQRQVTYENTYKMDPTGCINIPTIKAMIVSVLEDKFCDTRYNPHMMGFICKRTSDAILEEMKKFKFERFKFVCNVTISENTGQGIRQSSQFLWNDKFDNWTDANYTNSTLIVQGAVYMLYYE